MTQIIDHPLSTQSARLSVISVCLSAILFTGCATVNSAHAPTVSSTACTADTDTFCVERQEDAAARLNRRGIEQVQEQNFDQALELFKQAIRLDATNPELYYGLGVAYNGKQMPVESEAAYNAGLAIQSSNPQHTLSFAMIRFNLACLYALQGKKDAAFEQLEKLFALDKKFLFHWVEADADLDSLRDDPRFKEILSRRGVEEGGLPEGAGQSVGSGEAD